MQEQLHVELVNNVFSDHFGTSGISESSLSPDYQNNLQPFIHKRSIGMLGYKLSDFVRFSQGNSLLLKAFLIEPALFSQLSVPNSYDLVSFIKQTWCDILDEINNFIIWTWKNRWEWGCFTGTCCRLLGCVTCRLLWWTAVQMFAVSVQAQLVTSVKSAEWDGHSTTTPV